MKEFSEIQQGQWFKQGSYIYMRTISIGRYGQDYNAVMIVGECSGDVFDFESNELVEPIEKKE